MLTLLGSLIGFGSSFLPKILSFIETREQNKQEIRLMEKQAELTRITAEFERDKAQVQALSAEPVALYQADAAEAASLEKGSWISAYRASVRPSIAYIFLLLALRLKGGNSVFFLFFHFCFAFFLNWTLIVSYKGASVIRDTSTVHACQPSAYIV